MQIWWAVGKCLCSELFSCLSAKLHRIADLQGKLPDLSSLVLACEPIVLRLFFFGITILATGFNLIFAFGTCIPIALRSMACF